MLQLSSKLIKQTGPLASLFLGIVLVSICQSSTLAQVQMQRVAAGANVDGVVLHEGNGETKAGNDWESDPNEKHFFPVQGENVVTQLMTLSSSVSNAQSDLMHLVTGEISVQPFQNAFVVEHSSNSECLASLFAAQGIQPPQIANPGASAEFGVELRSTGRYRLLAVPPTKKVTLTIEVEFDFDEIEFSPSLAPQAVVRISTFANSQAQEQSIRSILKLERGFHGITVSGHNADDNEITGQVSSVPVNESFQKGTVYTSKIVLDGGSEFLIETSLDPFARTALGGHMLHPGGLINWVNQNESLDARLNVDSKTLATVADLAPWN